MEKGENKEEYLKRDLEKGTLTQQATKEFNESNRKLNDKEQENNKKCRRCSKPVEKTRSCGKANCPY